MASFSAENARVSVILRARPPAEKNIDPSQTVRMFPEQPGLVNIRYAALSGLFVAARLSY